MQKVRIPITLSGVLLIVLVVVDLIFLFWMFSILARPGA